VVPVSGHDGTWNSPKPGVFRGFLKLVENWRNPWNPISRTSKILEEPQKIVQNEVLDCILGEGQDETRTEMKQDKFLSAMSVASVHK